MMLENLTDKNNKLVLSLLKPKKIRTTSINLENPIQTSKRFRNSKY